MRLKREAELKKKVTFNDLELNKVHNGKVVHSWLGFILKHAEVFPLRNFREQRKMRLKQHGSTENTKSVLNVNELVQRLIREKKSNRKMSAAIIDEQDPHAIKQLYGVVDAKILASKQRKSVINPHRDIRKSVCSAIGRR